MQFSKKYNSFSFIYKKKSTGLREYRFLLQIWPSHRVDLLWSIGPRSTTIVGRRFKERRSSSSTGTHVFMWFSFSWYRACGNGTHVKKPWDTERDRSSREVVVAVAHKMIGIWSSQVWNAFQKNISVSKGDKERKKRKIEIIRYKKIIQKWESYFVKIE